MMNEHALGVDHVSLGYGRSPVVTDLQTTFPPGLITSIVGANGCGKSTLLRGLARLLMPLSGTVLLDGKSIHAQRSKEIAKRLGLLPQGPTVPEGLTVEELVSRGRYPHQTFRRQWSVTDEQAVEEALRLTRTSDLRDRPVDELSGGQRQRVWIALVLAQDTSILLLDEPTTFLDIAHQLEVLGLLRELNDRQNRTVILVLHDLNQAARYSHHLIAMREGQIVAAGPPQEIVTVDVVQKVFGIQSVIIDDPVTGTPLCVPKPNPGHTPVPAARK
ncbi:ABC-type cobalamin/Fe3+-siderophore transport system, ATPase component [Frankia torreyi]|uniref:ABC-type cobalamin/Fe3+-siderophore transport system, ATPase component n=2 Tax=Frankia TaxID=1854 RepID=A0A0D8BL99_9ACTN|nr:ABC-type cobalamin/Fe3+-siderophore transport system, ATPase component [Frankia torreyi]